jgi:DNA repair protein RadC
MNTSNTFTFPVKGTNNENAIIAEALKILKKRHRKGRKITCPQDTRDYLQLSLAEEKNEVFAVMYMDNRHSVIDLKMEFYGTIDGASVYPRVLVQHALELNASAVILCHNHPSGVNEPSTADIRITRRIQDALGLIDVRVLDHFIVTNTQVTSLAEIGQM